MAVRAAICATGLLLTVALGAFLIRYANGGADSALIPARGATSSRSVPGFGQVGFKVTRPSPPVPPPSRTLCALLATTEAQQRRGLMNRHDLAGYDGMVFRFNRTTTVPFFMKDTLIALSIAWFDSTGKFLNAATMSPCPKTSLRCPLYSATAPYTVAIEVRVGVLPLLGIGPGANLVVGGPC